MNNIQRILDVLGIVSCAVGAVLTGEIGFLVATIWAITSFISHLTNY